MRTGLDRPGDRCNLIAFAGYAEDVARDAGDVSACLELNFVRATGNALVAHVEGCILGKIEARSLHCGAGVLERAVGADLKVDGVLRGSQALASAAMVQVFMASIFMLVTWMP